jgi:Arylsulfotransferase (ASST)
VRRRLSLAVCAAFLALATPAVATPVVARPSLKPVFRSERPDYTVRCRAGEPVDLTIDPPRDTRVAVGAGKARSGRFTASADLVPGRAVALQFVRAEGTRVYVVRCIPPDFPNWRAKRSGTPQSRWYLLTPYGKSLAGYPSGPGYVAIFDSVGVPVWWMQLTPAPYAADLLANGNLSWTDFVAHSPFSKNFEERTVGGRIVRTWATVGWETNQHDFQPLPNGNALLVTYMPRDHVDLRQWGGPQDATVLDGEVQEIDRQGGLVWSWNTKDHVALGEAGRWLPGLIQKPTIFKQDGTPIYDVAHVNSLEPTGNLVVISARYLDAVYGIDRTSHGIAWKLGGTQTSRSLAIEGDPLRGSDFGGQHDARLVSRGKVLTVYDNGSKRHRLPRALAFRLDVANRSATLIRSLEYPRAGESVCCGSARRLPGGNWVVSWGNTPWVTELTPSGQPVLAIGFDEDVASYRAVPIPRGRLSRAGLRRAMDAMATGS